MSNKTKPQEALIKIRKATGLTQRDFADAVASTASTIQLIENGLRNITPQLAARISAYTGCNEGKLLAGRAFDLGGREYTSKSFEYWAKVTSVSEKDVKLVADQIAKMSALLVEVASSLAPGSAPDQHQFRQVTTLISQALDEIQERFHLGAALNAKLAADASAGDWEEMELGTARNLFQNAYGWDEIDDPTKDSQTKIEIRYTRCPLWSSIFGSSFNGEPANFAMALPKYRKKVEVRTGWKDGIAVLWFIELSTPCGIPYEMRPEEPKIPGN